ncbi:MAG: ABC transporter ATP-binding protein [Bacteroidetes bacterium]|nr:ABC transporter ATP-binding protein [Bacteroidota bacterium]
MNTLRSLIPYVMRYRWRLIAGLVAITISNVFSILIPRYVGHTVDTIAHGSGPGHVTAEFLLQQGLIIVGLSIGSGVFLFLTRQTIIVLSRLVEYDLRNNFLSHVQSLSVGWFNNTPTGDVMALATNDIGAVREFVGPAVMYTANTITTFLFAMTMMLTLSVKITLLALIPLPLVSYSVYRLGKRIHGLFGDVQKQYADLTSQAQENMSGVRVVRAYVREQYAIDAFASMSRLYRTKNMRLVKTQALMMPVMMALIGLSQLIVLGVGGLDVARGVHTIGDITQFFGYISQLIWPVIAIGWVTNLVQRGIVSMGRLNKIFDMKPEIADSSGTDNMVTAIGGRIEFRNVSFRYRPELPLVLKDVSFTVNRGDTLAIIGRTGSGKTTIVNLIARMYDVTEGEILIDGRPIKSIPIHVLRSAIGVVTQETFLFSDTIAGNIRFGRREAPMGKVEEAAKIARLYDNVEGFPNKFETIVGERGITLSGGQKQRTSIARAVLREPNILMLDDALSAVDTETEDEILMRLRDVMRNRTSILIAHRISTVKDADQIIVLDHGGISEQGTHEELLELRGEYSRIYERQLLEAALESL